ncbi:hypothetical protein L3Q82_020367, partial [Scortum barcoo]
MIGGLAALIVLSTAFSEKDDGKFFYWFQQSLGYMFQTVASVIRGQLTISERFKGSRFNVTKDEAHHLLTIRNVSKEDEATYFCLNVGSYSQSSGKGVFLAVKDHNQQKSVIVKQSPETASVQPGGSVTLQCSLLSKNKENRVQCPGTAVMKKRKELCLQSVQTIQNSSDTGTYYCAVATCGEILFGKEPQWRQ